MSIYGDKVVDGVRIVLGLVRFPPSVSFDGKIGAGTGRPVFVNSDSSSCHVSQFSIFVIGHSVIQRRPLQICHLGVLILSSFR